MGREDRQTWKKKYFMTLIQLLGEYPKCFIVGVDNVGSKQMQQIRVSLRKHATLLMGKNTMIRKAIRDHLGNNDALGKLLPHIKGNVGFVFTTEDLVEVRDKIMDNKVKAPARAGAIAPCDVILQPQNTGLGPEKTSFFQALQIPTKISKGTIEILNEIHIIKKDEKVGASEATLLNMLNISPFTYGLVIRQVYNSGTIFAPEVLDITHDDLRAKFMNGVARLAGVCLSVGYPSLVSAPHMLANGLKNLIALAIASDYDLPEAQKARDYLKDPSKYAVAAAPAAAADAKEEKKEEAKVEEEENESEDDDMGFGLFD